jgi:transposase InsO family protein
LWSLPSRKTTWSSTPSKQCGHHQEAFGASTHGPLWTGGLPQYGGNKYGLVIVDDFSRFTWVFFLSNKGETQEILKKLMRRAQNEFELKIKKIRSDNATEFKNTCVDQYLIEEGIKHEFSIPYAPQQNDVVERNNQTLIETTRIMLDEYKTLDNYWDEVVNIVCHAINSLYLHKIYKKTSYELLNGNKPKVDYFRVFGHKCFILNEKAKGSKFAPKVDEGFLLGYASNAHGYRVFNNTTSVVEIAVDVTFDESNGSQGHVANELTGNEVPPCEPIMKLAIGEVRPQEKDEDEEFVTEPPKILGPPTAVLVPRNLDSHADAPNSFIGPDSCIFFNLSQERISDFIDITQIEVKAERVTIT